MAFSFNNQESNQQFELPLSSFVVEASQPSMPQDHSGPFLESLQQPGVDFVSNPASSYLPPVDASEPQGYSLDSHPGEFGPGGPSVTFYQPDQSSSYPEQDLDPSTAGECPAETVFIQPDQTPAPLYSAELEAPYSQQDSVQPAYPYYQQPYPYYPQQPYPSYSPNPYNQQPAQPDPEKQQSKLDPEKQQAKEGRPKILVVLKILFIVIGCISLAMVVVDVEHLTVGFGEFKQTMRYAVCIDLHRAVNDERANGQSNAGRGNLERVLSSHPELGRYNIRQKKVIVGNAWYANIIGQCKDVQ